MMAVLIKGVHRIQHLGIYASGDVREHEGWGWYQNLAVSGVIFYAFLTCFHREQLCLGISLKVYVVIVVLLLLSSW